MAQSENPTKLFNDAFYDRYKGLQELYNTPSSTSDVSFLISPDLIKAAANSKPTPETMTKPASSCGACEAMAKPLPCVKSGGSDMMSNGSGMSWLLGILLVVGVFLIIFGIYQIFRSSSDRNRGNRGWLPKTFGAPHHLGGGAAGGAVGGAAVGGAAGGGFGPIMAHQDDSMDISDPDRIIPDPSDQGVTLIFYHAPWCGHCQQFRPLYEAVAQKHAGKAKFKAVVSDVLQKSKHADKVPIKGFPTVFVFVNGQHVDSMVGNQGESALEQLIAKHTQS